MKNYELQLAAVCLGINEYFTSFNITLDSVWFGFILLGTHMKR